MILCNYQSEWLLATKANPDTPSCALVGGNWSRLSTLDFKNEERQSLTPGYECTYVRWSKFMPSMEHIRFYPRLSYRGFPVVPDRWHPNSSEKQLGCLLGDLNPLIEKESGITHAMIVEANNKRADDEHAWKEFHQRRKGVVDRIYQKVEDDGWSIVERSIYFQYIDVEDPDFIKIEGPAPEAAF